MINLFVFILVNILELILFYFYFYNVPCTKILTPPLTTQLKLSHVFYAF